MKALITFVSILFVLSTPVSASQTAPADQDQPVITGTSTLPDLLAEAALRNPGLKAAFENWQAALQEVPQARALPNPQLSYAYFIREIETRVGPQQHKVGFMQMFPWFGKLKLKGGMAAEMANAARQRYQNQKLALFYRVRSAYYDYYLAVRTIAILGENVRLLDFLETIIRTRYRTGAAPYSSLIKIQVERDRLKDRLNSARDRLDPVKSVLNAALDRPIDAALPVPKDLPEIAPGEPSREKMAELVKTNNPGLKSMDYLTAKSRLGIKLAKKNYYPDFSVGMDYMITGQARMPGVPDSGKDPLAAMVSLQLPLWSKKNKAAVREANARYRAALLQKKEAENSLLTHLETVLFMYRDGQRKIKLYNQSLLPLATQALEVTRSAFETGNATFLDFIDSQRTLLSFRLQYEETRTHSARSFAELQMLTGEEDFKKH